MFLPIMRAVDKLDKIGIDKVMEALVDLKLDRSAVDQINALITKTGTNDEKIAYASAVVNESDVIEELKETVRLLAFYNLKTEVVVDFSLVRGLDYYTGTVFELKIDFEGGRTTLCGGGRYDKLIGLYGGKDMPVVGAAIGIDRLLDIMNYASSPQYTYSKVFVACVTQANYAYALKVTNLMRANGINSEVNTAKRNLSNQLNYASAIKTKYALIIGDAEEKANKVKLRNLISGEEQTVGIDEAMKTIKKF